MSSRRPKGYERLRRAGIRSASMRQEQNVSRGTSLPGDPSLALVREARARILDMLPQDWIPIWGDALARSIERLVAERDELVEGRLEGLEEIRAACVGFRAIMDAVDRWEAHTGRRPGAPPLSGTAAQALATQDFVSTVREAVVTFSKQIRPPRPLPNRPGLTAKDDPARAAAARKNLRDLAAEIRRGPGPEATLDEEAESPNGSDPEVN